MGSHLAKLVFSYLATLPNISFGGKTTQQADESMAKQDVLKPLIIVNFSPFTRVGLMYIEQ